MAMLIHGIHVNNEAVPHTGTITEINDTYFYVQITARMGVLKLPLRCLISEHRPKIGDNVRFLMSYVEMQNDNYEKEASDKL
ncbi:CBO2463/CBO2479 domain-containing protein [Mogibacterium timidum]